MKKDEGKTKKPTERQGQFLAYIFQYSLVNGCAPAEADMQRYFQITPPSVHSMVLTLERRGFIRRVPGQARSITLIVPPESNFAGIKALHQSLRLAVENPRV
jgi:DNA-binding MarR family transcriptional regulator